MSDYDRVARVIAYLDAHRCDQPDLSTLAEQVGLSPAHFQRLFTRWAGVSPKAFLQCLTVSHARRLLEEGASVLDAALDVGLSGPGRLHDLTVKLEAASPGEVKAGGAGWTLRAGLGETPFGLALVAASPRGVCHLSFVDDADRARAEALLRADWPRADLAWDDGAAADLLARVFVAAPALGTSSGAPSGALSGAPPLRALVRGTPFQLKVWRSLLRVPPGACVSYAGLASSLGKPSAARAVGAAVGRNGLGFLIPCHRVIRGTGALGGYRWGEPRKRAMLAWEGARAQRAAR